MTTAVSVWVVKPWTSVTTTVEPTEALVTVPLMLRFGLWLARRAPSVIVTTGGVVSMVSCWAAVPTLPARSVIDTATVYVPLIRLCGVTLQPDPVTVVVRVWVNGPRCSVTLTRAPRGAVVVPLIVGRGLALTAYAEPTMVTTGATVSMTRFWVAVPTLPARSVTATETLTGPSSTMFGLTLHPVLVTTVGSVCRTTPLRVRVTRTAVPIGLLVVPLIGAVGSLLCAEAGPVMATAGATVLMMRRWVAVPMFPARR